MSRPIFNGSATLYGGGNVLDVTTRAGDVSGANLPNSTSGGLLGLKFDAGGPQTITMTTAQYGAFNAGGITLGFGSTPSQNTIVLKDAGSLAANNSVLNYTLATAGNTIAFNQSAPTPFNAHLLSNYLGTADVLKLGATALVARADGGVTDTYTTGGFDTTAASPFAFLSDVAKDASGSAHVAAYNDGSNTWVASVDGSGHLINVVELVGVNTLTSIATVAGASVVVVG